MSQSSSNLLSQEVAVMADVFSDLGERLLHAARELHAPGTPPPQELLDELSACRKDLDGLRERSRTLAAALHIACPPDDRLQNLQSITALLDDVAEAEIRQSKSDEVRRRALFVLQRVLSLSQSTQRDFAPLLDCQGKARDLICQIADAPWTSLPGEAERLAEGDHAFTHLLSLIEDREDLHDDHWAHLHESVGALFSKPLAAAAARSKLVLPADSAAHSENGFSHGADHYHGNNVSAAAGVGY